MAIHNDLACFCGQAFDLGGKKTIACGFKNIMTVKGICNAIKLKDFGPSM